MANECFIAGTEFAYDITSGIIYRYAVALAYRTKGYNVGISIDHAQLATASFFQNVSKLLQVGSRATLNPKLGSILTLNSLQDICWIQVLKLKLRLQVFGN